MTDPKERRRARKDALVVAAALAALGAWNLYRGRLRFAIAVAAVAAALAVIGLLIPSAAALFSKSWMRFASALAYVNTRVLLSLMYWGVMAPLGIFMRLFGRDVLMRRGPSRESYWIARSAPSQSRESFERTF